MTTDAFELVHVQADHSYCDNTQCQSDRLPGVQKMWMRITPQPARANGQPRLGIPTLLCPECYEVYLQDQLEAAERAQAEADAPVGEVVEFSDEPAPEPSDQGRLVLRSSSTRDRKHNREQRAGR